MFCGKCGTKNADDAMFCSGCGAKLNGGETVKSEIPATPVAANPNGKNRKVGIIAVAVIVVAVVGLVSMLFGSRGYEDVVEKFVDAQFEADAETILELMPEELIEYVLEEEGLDEDEWDVFIEEANEDLEKELDSLDRYLGKGWKISYEIKDDHNLLGNALDDLQDAYEEMGIEVSEAKTVEVEISIIAGKSGGEENKKSLDVCVIKVGRSWYLDMASMGGIF